MIKELDFVDLISAVIILVAPDVAHGGQVDFGEVLFPHILTQQEAGTCAAPNSRWRQVYEPSVR